MKSNVTVVFRQERNCLIISVNLFTQTTTYKHKLQLNKGISVEHLMQISTRNARGNSIKLQNLHISI